ncbi:MAG: hypothetical protein SFT81_07385 [Candidatus Caenarcaniphilales bacterium]|nr:hypothetical protein [Candidatus Caenarcaniphilales bacterium]
MVAIREINPAKFPVSQEILRGIYTLEKSEPEAVAVLNQLSKVPEEIKSEPISSNGKKYTSLSAFLRAKRKERE